MFMIPGLPCAVYPDGFHARFRGAENILVRVISNMNDVPGRVTGPFTGGQKDLCCAAVTVVTTVGIVMMAHTLSGILFVQIALGFTAYFVLLNESGILIPSNLQVIINTLHLVVGALLFATAVSVAVWSYGMPAPVESAQESSGRLTSESVAG